MKQELHIDVTRSARVWMLGDVASAQELWIVCHGYGQLAEKFLEHFTLLESTARCVIAPEGLHRYYIDPLKVPAAERRIGATWMTREDRLTDIADYVRYLDTLHAIFVRPGVRVRVLGFSQGASTVLRWAMLGRAHIDQLILWGGEVPNDVAIDKTLPPILFIRGTRDEFLRDDILARHLDALRAVDADYRLLEFDGGHTINDELLQTIAKGF